MMRAVEAVGCIDDGRGDSPIWRLPAAGQGDLEAIIDDGYLLAIVDVW